VFFHQLLSLFSPKTQVEGRWEEAPEEGRRRGEKRRRASAESSRWLTFFGPEISPFWGEVRVECKFGKKLIALGAKEKGKK